MKLSVFVVTYNQEQYIRQCLDSIVMQRVNFEYEVIIGEDCSSDKTPVICDEYAKKYSFIHVCHHMKNLGLVKNWEFVLNHCTGDYVAMIEGDDYWLDENKLQTQIDWLDTHPDYLITSTNVDVRCEDGLQDANDWFPSRKSGDVDIKEYLYPGICHTTSVVMRNIFATLKYPSWIYMADTYTFMLAAQQGKAYHFEKKFSVYRRHNKCCTVQDTLYDVISMMKWATQHRNMQIQFPEAKELLLEYEEKDLYYLSKVSRKDAPIEVWKYRLRYINFHKKLILSKYLIRTILYLPLINKLLTFLRV